MSTQTLPPWPMYLGASRHHARRVRGDGHRDRDRRIERVRREHVGPGARAVRRAGARPARPAGETTVSPVGQRVADRGRAADGRRRSAIGLETMIVSVPVSPRTNMAGECVASIPSASGATNQCAGGVPARSRKLYGTGFVACGIGVAEDT